MRDIVLYLYTICLDNGRYIPELLGKLYLYFLPKREKRLDLCRNLYFYGRVRRISHNDLRTTSLPVRYMPDSERMCRASDFYPSRKILQVHLSLQPHPFQSRGSEDSKHSPVFLGIFLWSSGLSPHSKHISDPWRRW